MTHSIPLVVSIFYITAGYLLVAGGCASAVMALSRSFNNRVAYGALAALSFSGFGYQLATALYYQSSDLSFAILALKWQMDFASLGLVCSYIFISFESVERQHPKRVLGFGLLLVVIMVLVNRLTSYSLHFDSVEGLLPFGADSRWLGLSYVEGVPGLVTRIWYATIAVVLVWGVGVVVQIFRQVGRARASFVGLYIGLLASSIAASALIDWSIWSGIYLVGFAIMVFVVVMSTNLIMRSTRRSQQLTLRDREMQAEIIERRYVESKLRRLSQVFTQEPVPNHIVNRNGDTLLVNEESVRFLRCDVSQTPNVNFLDVLESLGESREAVLRQLETGEACEFGPYYFVAGVPVDTLFFVRDCWINFKLSPIFDGDRCLEEFVVRLEDVTEQQFVDTAINTISNAVSTETGQAFFTSLVVYLARLLEKKYVLIGLLVDIDGEPHLQTLAASVDGELTDNFTIKIQGSPIGVILQNGTYSVARRAQEDFPWLTLLKQMGIQSYVGVAITDERKVNIGAFMVMDAKPMDHVEKIEDLVKIFVSRAGSELNRIESEKTIRKMAFEDQLTGLPNRVDLNEYVGKLLEQQEGESAFIQLDLDHFKTINDALGHNVGDQVIQRLGKRLIKATRGAHYVARIGGDEFAIVVKDLGKNPEKNIVQLALQLLSLLERPVAVGDHLLDVGCTIGIVLFPQYAHTVVDVFRNADIALHKAKLAGRGGYQLFTPEMRNEVNHRIGIEKGLRQALQNKEFSLVYQPQLNASGALIGAEALLRWQHPKRGFIPPDVFIPVAEETGLINPIGEWVLQEALSKRKRWFEGRLPFSGHLSVNVSAWQFGRPDFVETTLAAIAKAKVAPSFITLEVTETAVLSDIKDTIDKLAELRRSGFSIALDDFGTGYSSLAYLRDLPLDSIKIDKSFVDVLETQAQEPLVESMVSIGKHMGLEVVAEGVETQVQLDRLRAIGCHAFQGYFFARPLSEEAFIKWLIQYEARRTESPFARNASNDTFPKF